MLAAKSLTVILTNQCNAECDHCCMNSGPGRTETVDIKTVRTAIDELHERRPLDVVVFAGGEATLVKSTLRQAIQHCASKGISTRLVTNASWAKTRETAERVLGCLRKDGLSELNFSADDFHLPFIPLNNVINAWEAAKGKGFKSVLVANSCSTISEITPSHIRERLGVEEPIRTDRHGNAHVFVLPSDDGTFYGISSSSYQRLERAERKVPDAYFDSGDDGRMLACACPYAFRSPALSPKGHLLACCGFELDDNAVLDLGDIGSATVGSLQTKALDDPLLKGIIYLGPYYLMNLAKQVAPEIRFKERYGAVCEVCRSIVRNPRAIHLLREHENMYLPSIELIERQSDPLAA